jgi:hypothetical protein
MWPKLTALAHTLPHDGALVADLQRGEPLPAGLWGNVAAPALVIAGGRSPAWLQSGSRALAAALAYAEYRVLEGQTHDVSAKAVAPLLSDFFGGAGSSAYARRTVTSATTSSRVPEVPRSTWTILQATPWNSFNRADDRVIPRRRRRLRQAFAAHFRCVG